MIAYRKYFIAKSKNSIALWLHKESPAASFCSISATALYWTALFHELDYEAVLYEPCYFVSQAEDGKLPHGVWSLRKETGVLLDAYILRAIH